jgi:hypothetical protein
MMSIGVVGITKYVSTFTLFVLTSSFGTLLAAAVLGALVPPGPRRLLAPGFGTLLAAAVLDAPDPPGPRRRLAPGFGTLLAAAVLGALRSNPMAEQLNELVRVE